MKLLNLKFLKMPQFKLILTTIIFLLSINVFASSLFEDAQERGINEKCSSYLDNIEKSYGLNGLNLTFTHPQTANTLPTFHVSTQKYNNGASAFAATLMPDNDKCYVSTVFVTSIVSQTCKKILQVKIETDQDLQVSSYLEGGYTVISPKDNSYQTILTSLGQKGCTMTETRMFWDGS